MKSAHAKDICLAFNLSVLQLPVTIEAKITLLLVNLKGIINTTGTTLFNVTIVHKHQRITKWKNNSPSLFTQC